MCDNFFETDFSTYFTSFEVMQTSISLPLLHQQQQGIRHNKYTKFKILHSKFILMFFDGQIKVLGEN